jgi:hypothetical protein
MIPTIHGCMERKAKLNALDEPEYRTMLQVSMIGKFG